MGRQRAEPADARPEAEAEVGGALRGIPLPQRHPSSRGSSPSAFRGRGWLSFTQTGKASPSPAPPSPPSCCFHFSQLFFCLIETTMEVRRMVQRILMPATETQQLPPFCHVHRLSLSPENAGLSLTALMRGSSAHISEQGRSSKQPQRNSRTLEN